MRAKRAEHDYDLGQGALTQLSNPNNKLSRYNPIESILCV
jgi:hypothetical protein